MQGANEEKIIEILSLSENKKALFQQRYINLLRDYKLRSTRYTISFHTLRIIVGVGSLLVPALLSIQQINATSTECHVLQDLEKLLFWSTWVLSLLVTMSNGLFTLMKVDKKYYFIHTLLEQLRSEGWQFLTMTGRYTIYRTADISGGLQHDKAFGLFCHMVEKIKMHQVEEEYYKLTDDYTKQQEKPGNTTAIQIDSGNKEVVDKKEGVGVGVGGGVSVNSESVKKPIISSMPNTEIRILPKTPQGPLNLDGLPPEMREQMRGLMEEAFREMGVTEEVYTKYFNRQEQ